MTKPLGHKAYGSIPHLPGSRLGPADHCVNDGQAEIATVGRSGYTVFIQEKLDGSCTAVAKIDGEILALGRAGYLAETSTYKMHHMFARWVDERKNIFDGLLNNGERVVGEWLAQAHGTIYKIATENDLWAPFDIMNGHDRVPTMQVYERLEPTFRCPQLLLANAHAPNQLLMSIASRRQHSRITDDVEGVVYRIEKGGRVIYLTKYVVSDKVDGQYLDQDIWNQIG